MNEITKIHLGRIAFTIAVDAHRALKEYLHAIKKHMGDTDEAVEEVELRMAELLVERGITGDKVVLLKDVDFLKEQLGEPGDFGDEVTTDESEDNTSTTPKRLFRDTNNAMLAGVAAGIAKYLGVDAVWVRLAFVGLVFLGASGILLYIILWLIVPEAKTSSERLQMQGKPVTVDALKDVVERADVKAAAHRATSVAGKVVHTVLKVLLAVVGIGLMIGAISALLGLTTSSVYWTLNPDIIPANIFPIGVSEISLVVVAVLFIAIFVLFLLFGGLALVKRKWPLPGWGLGAMIAVWLACLAIGGALVADTAPKVRDRYEASQHTEVTGVRPFTKLKVIGTLETSITYEESMTPSVSIKYWGDLDLSKMKAEVKDQILTVDSTALAESTRCKKVCLFHSPVLEVTIRGPKLSEVYVDAQGAQLKIPNVHDQTLIVRTQNSSVYLPDVMADNVKAERNADGSWTFVFSGAYKGVTLPQDVYVFERTATITANKLDLKFQGECGVAIEKNTSEPIQLVGQFEALTLNGKFIGPRSDLRKAFDEPGMSAAKCLTINQIEDYDDAYSDSVEDSDEYERDAVNDSL